jgi:uncharacterized protein (TIGR00369 family)
MSHELGLHLSGMEKLKIMLDQDLRCPMGETLDIKLIEAEDGRAVFESSPNEKFYNPNYVIHGGFIATMLDFACGYAALGKLQPSQSIATAEIKVAYHRPVNLQTGLIQAEGRVVSNGRRMIFVEAKLTDANGKLLASATSTLLILDLTN